jgi:hypothetical protein
VIVIGSSSEAEDAETAAEAHTEAPNVPRLPVLGLATFDASTRACITSVKLGYPPGRMMAAGFDHVVTFYGHPRLVSLVSREVVHEWIDIETDRVVSSIDRAADDARVLALDPVHARFAVADRRTQSVDIIELDLDAGLPVNAVEGALRSRGRGPTP